MGGKHFVKLPLDGRLGFQPLSVLDREPLFCQHFSIFQKPQRKKAAVLAAASFHLIFCLILRSALRPCFSPFRLKLPFHIKGGFFRPFMRKGLPGIKGH